MNAFRILSIDGGGMKGMFSAAFLASLERLCGKRIVDHFDLIVGTSTGGIIALGLGLGMPAQTLLDFYLAEGEKIFPGGRIARSLRAVLGLLRPKYCAAPLEDALRNRFKNMRLGDSKSRLVIPAFNPATGDVYLYKTAHHPKLKEDYKERAWRVARATSSAPTFFRSHRVGFLTDIIDGGVWANNPSMIALTEAIGILKQSPDCIAMLSIGTALSNLSIGEKTRERGGIVSWGWTISRRLFMHVQAITAHKQAQHILEGGRYVRIDPSTCDVSIPMDDPKKARVLIPHGEQAARHCRDAVEDLFFTEPAKPFIPVYPLSNDEIEAVSLSVYEERQAYAKPESHR